MELQLVLTTIAILLILLSLLRKRKHPLYPKGPSGLPLIGNLHQLGKTPYLALRKWKIKYGNVYSIKLARDDAIVLNDPKMIISLFRDPAASGRIQNHLFSAPFESPDIGVANTEGKAWMEQRRFILRKLRDMGYGKSSLEGKISEEAKNVVKWFQQNAGTPISVKRAFNTTVVNSLWSIATGERVEGLDENGEESELSRNMIGIVRGLQQAMRSGVMFVPALKYIIPELSGWRPMLRVIATLRKLFKETIARHEAALDVNCPRDLVDHFLIEIGRTQDSTSSFFKERGRENLIAALLELFIAGNESTSETFTWIILYLSCHPQVQRKLVEEIQRVVGKSREPVLADKQKLPYTEAVILEVFRKSTMGPMGVPRRMLEDKMFHGYFFPKHTILISDNDSCFNDPQYWGDPGNFRPERFLSEDGTKVVTNEALMPFGTGRRQCLGEPLAKDTIFLFIVAIFQKLEIGPDPENMEPDLEPETGLANLPKPFKIVVKELC